MLSYSKILGDTVRSARAVLNLSQEELASRIGSSYRFISDIEHYNGNPTFNLLVPLIRVLHINANDVFFPESQQQLNPSIQRLILLVKSCDDSEAEDLIPIVEAALSVKRKKK